MMRTWIVLLALVAVIVCPASSGDETKSAYEQAQALKRSGRFDEARTAFQELAAASGGSTWSTLAADELRYGLPLHESNLLIAKMARTTDHASRAHLLKRIDSLYQAMLSDNMDRPERIGEIERKRDQLSLARQMAGKAEQDGFTAGLRQLRYRIEHFHNMTGRWPDRRQIETEVSGMLSNAGLAPDRLTLFDFYPTSSSFYATLRDSRGGPDIKIKADGGSVRIEGGGL